MRAALVLAAMAISLLDGCPLPRMQARHLDDPLNQVELARWSGFLAAAGVDLPPAALGERVVALSDRLRDAHAKAMAPFRPALDVFGVRQRFALFPVAKRRFLWFRIDAKREGEPWQLLYRPGDPEHPPPLAALEHRRVRALVTAGSLGPNDELPAVSAYLADALFARDARLARVRTGYAWTEIDPRGGSIHPDPELVFVHEHARSDR